MGGDTAGGQSYDSSGAMQNSAEQLSGTILSYNESDSLLIVRTKGGQDTFLITPQTVITFNNISRNPSDLQPNKRVKIWYDIQNGRKVAAQITDIQRNIAAEGNSDGGCAGSGAIDSNGMGDHDGNGTYQYPGTDTTGANGSDSGFDGMDTTIDTGSSPYPQQPQQPGTPKDGNTPGDGGMGGSDGTR